MTGGIPMSKLKIWLKSIVALVLIVAVLFLVPGRWDLPMVWAYIAIYAGFMLLAWLFIFRKNPDLVKERQQSGPGAKRWDRIWLNVYSGFLLLLFVVAGLDVGRFHWSDSVPFWLQIAGLIGFAASLGFSGWALAVNTFFSETVRIQRDRGHHVITSGPYRFVRHPGYVGNIVAWFCTALVFDSWWALLPAAVIVALYVLRTALEDRTLQQELDGYAEYARQVRYRLLPGVW
jgi:protein-S-isoprenylcysteine O-methyltransferase Ste14